MKEKAAASRLFDLRKKCSQRDSSCCYYITTESATDARAVLLEAMKLGGAVYDADFRDVMETYEGAGGGLLEKKIDFVLINPPYNIRYNRNMDQHLHDVLHGKTWRTWWS